jgi:23S rRNA (cytosine1962-C5)-methyltransferase
MDQPFGKYLMFRNRLEKVYRHLSKQARRQGIGCFRLYDHDLPEFPFILELYEDRLYVSEYKRRHALSDEEHGKWLDDCKQIMADVLSISTQNIFLRMRQRKAGRGGQYQKIEDEKAEFVVHESELKFIVNLSDYLDTGLFLDHRITRSHVRDMSKGKRMLNLFAYTGSFSVYAAAGGAAQVVTVDLSKTYLQWAERNMEINFGTALHHQMIHADVLQYLKTLPAEGFDLIVMDPPTFSNSKRMEDFLDIQRDHVQLINDCLHCLSSGGVLIFSTNFTKFQIEKEKIDSDAVRDITRQTTPFDFEGKLKRQCFEIKKPLL